LSRDTITASFGLAVTEGKPFNHELQINTLKGNTKWVPLGKLHLLKVFVQVCALDLLRHYYCQRITYRTYARKENCKVYLQATNAGSWQWNIQTEETIHMKMGKHFRIPTV
jgi:hypothetical protein